MATLTVATTTIWAITIWEEEVVDMVAMEVGQLQQLRCTSKILLLCSIIIMIIHRVLSCNLIVIDLHQIQTINQVKLELLDK